MLRASTSKHKLNLIYFYQNFSKKLGNMVAFRKVGKPNNISDESDNVFLETFSTKTKRARLSIPLLEFNKKRGKSSGSCHNSEQVGLLSLNC